MDLSFLDRGECFYCGKTLEELSSHPGLWDCPQKCIRCRKPHDKWDMIKVHYSMDNGKSFSLYYFILKNELILRMFWFDKEGTHHVIDGEIPFIFDFLSMPKDKVVHRIQTILVFS